VKQSDLGEYKENAREKQDIQIYKIEHKFPVKPSHRDDRHQFPLTNQQIEKHQGVW
jgi:hypothetical protein